MTSSIDIGRFEQIKASGELPSPRGAALAIIRLTQQAEVSLQELARLIKADPAFVGRLVKAANGLLNGERRPVASVQEALMVLGVPAVRTMAVGFSLLSQYRTGGCKDFDYERYWSSSLLMALAMQLLTQRVRVAPPDEAFCLGLLARVGGLALATLYADGYGQILARHREHPDTSLVDLECQAFAMNHRELSAAMLADWGLPQVFTDAALHFEELERAALAPGGREQVLAQCLVIARAIAELCITEEDQRSSALPEILRVAAMIGMEAEAVVSVCDRLVKEWGEWGDLLDLPVAKLAPFGDLVKASTEGEALATGGGPVGGSASHGRVAGAIGSGAPRPPMSGLRVLVVEGDPSVRAALRSVLEQAGHQVFEAGNGRAGLDAALEIQPQMMVVDGALPGQDGLKVTKALRNTKIGRAMYILLLTNQEDDDRLIEAFENGVDDFFAKPVKPKVLAARLRAGQRVVQLQQEIEKDREEIRQFAAELAVTNRRLQQVALTDPLTGFSNRRYAIDRMAQEWAASTRSQRPLSCMVIDVDGFKKINDGHGHDVGDAVLIQVSSALKQALRSQDVIARIGGDEFLVICPETPLEAAIICGERLRKAVEGVEVARGEIRIALSISVGIATRESSMADPDALVKRADQGVYVAKQRGRNRVGTVQSLSRQGTGTCEA